MAEIIVLLADLLPGPFVAVPGDSMAPIEASGVDHLFHDRNSELFEDTMLLQRLNLVVLHGGIGLGFWYNVQAIGMHVQL